MTDPSETIVSRVIVCGPSGSGQRTLVGSKAFSSRRRRIIVTAAPGQDRFAGDMAAGAFAVDVAILLVDAREGVLTPARRHGYVVAQLGVRSVVLAVNKMDAVGYAGDVFDTTCGEYQAYARRLGLKDIVAIPISALRGDNVAVRSANTPWYRGPTLLEQLEMARVEAGAGERPMRFPVQSIANAGIAGFVAAGTVRKGDRIRALPSGRQSRVARNSALDEPGAPSTTTSERPGRCFRSSPPVLRLPLRRSAWPQKRSAPGHREAW